MTAEAVLQVKVWLIGISPMVWRRVLVPASFTLRELHGVIQVAMGWEGIHARRERCIRWQLRVFLRPRGGRESGDALGGALRRALGRRSRRAEILCRHWGVSGILRDRVGRSARTTCMLTGQ